jgi:hypothetical protein
LERITMLVRKDGTVLGRGVVTLRAVHLEKLLFVERWSFSEGCGVWLDHIHSSRIDRKNALITLLIAIDADDWYVYS